MMQKIIPYIILMILGTDLLIAQDLGQLNKTPVKVNGSIAVGSSFYKAIDRENRVSPFSYFISARPIFTVFGIKVPIEFTYRNQKSSVSKPFNRFGSQIKYKWANFHIGNLKMNINPYVLSGANIKGLGVEVTPGKFRLSVLRGNLKNPLAQRDSLAAGAEVFDQYRRQAYAVKIGVGGRKNYIDIIGFAANDDVNSVMNRDDLPQGITPQENKVGAIAFGIGIAKRLDITGNIATSLHTANKNLMVLDTSENNDFNKIRRDFENIIDVNLSTRAQLAGDVGISLSLSNTELGFEIQRVDPFYRSLGTYYFQEDYQNMLFTVKTRMAQNKFIVNGRFGKQKNNLSDLRAGTTSRTIMNLNLIYRPSPNFVSTLRYSNFQNENSDGFEILNDSLKYTRTTTGYGIAPRYSWGESVKRSTMSLSYNIQNLQDLLATDEINRSIENRTINLGYSLRLKEKGAQVSINTLFNKNEIGDLTRSRIGLSSRYTKSLKDNKMRITLSSSYTRNKIDGSNDGSSLTGKLGLTYKLDKQMNASFNLAILNRSGGQSNFKEVRGNMKLIYLLKNS